MVQYAITYNAPNEDSYSARLDIRVKNTCTLLLVNDVCFYTEITTPVMTLCNHIPFVTPNNDTTKGPRGFGSIKLCNFRAFDCGL